MAVPVSRLPLAASRIRRKTVRPAGCWHRTRHRRESEPRRTRRRTSDPPDSRYRRMSIASKDSLPLQAIVPTGSFAQAGAGSDGPPRMRLMPAIPSCFLATGVNYEFAGYWPPSTFSTVPVIQLARSEARKSTAFATSSGVPRRPDGIAAAASA